MEIKWRRVKSYFLHGLTSARDSKRVLNSSNCRSRLQVLFLNSLWTPGKYECFPLHPASACLVVAVSLKAVLLTCLWSHTVSHCGIELPGPRGIMMAQQLPRVSHSQDPMGMTTSVLGFLRPGRLGGERPSLGKATLSSFKVNSSRKSKSVHLGDHNPTHSLSRQREAKEGNFLSRHSVIHWLINSSRKAKDKYLPRTSYYVSYS